MWGTRQRTAAYILSASTLLFTAIGCESKPSLPAETPGPVNAGASTWLGIPSAVNQVIVFLHESTGWLLNKSQVDIKKVGDVRTVDEGELVAAFSIAVQLGDESFETIASDVPCDADGIPTDDAVDRLRAAVEDIKEKMSRLQL